MQILNSQDSEFESSLDKFISEPRSQNSNVEASVAKIIQAVKVSKNEALIKFTKQFDRISLRQDEMLVSDEEIITNCSKVPIEQKKAVDFAARRIKSFHKRQLPQDKRWTDKAGIEMGWRWQPIERVGLYVPGGQASYPSSVLMNAIPATIAGSKEIIMVSPTPDGKINPLVIYAARVSGVSKIYKIGGAQAIAALAFGTETIKPVDKIVGPGNAFVAEAKRQVFGRVGIDMVAGPSEVVIIADEDNRANWISADLLSQAEHDESAQAILITTNQWFAKEVLTCFKDQLSNLARRNIADKSWKKNGKIIVVSDLDKAASVSNRFAPEHLQLCVRNPDELLNSIKNAGSVFIGSWTPESLGDYVIGTNHVLPTENSSRFASGLSVLDFMKRSFVSRVTSDSVRLIGESAAVLARAEGLGAHELSVNLRIMDETKTN